ncbi:MAG: hypothetical protein IT328_24080, partial [Caldilineaceae bacterium]|nr:hypothetical protein [Caldilineaceae bacterium]
GATWSALATPAIAVTNRPAYAVHLPWPDNDDEMLAYYGMVNISSSIEQYRLKRVEADGTTVTDISPSDGTRLYGPNNHKFSIVTYDSNRQYVALGGNGNDTTTGGSGVYRGAWVSSDYGDTWANIVAPVSVGGAFTRAGIQLAFSGTDPNVLYLWGGDINYADTIPVIAYTNDFGTTVDDRTGNIRTLFDTGSSGFHKILGIAGGPTA